MWDSWRVLPALQLSKSDSAAVALSPSWLIVLVKFTNHNRWVLTFWERDGSPARAKMSSVIFTNIYILSTVHYIQYIARIARINFFLGKPKCDTAIWAAEFFFGCVQYYFNNSATAPTDKSLFEQMPLNTSSPSSRLSTMVLLSPKSLVTLLVLSTTLWLNVLAFVSPSPFCSSRTSVSARASSRDDLEYLPLSKNDIVRLSQMRDRHITIPILILDPLLPGQCLELASSDDRKFQELVNYVLSSQQQQKEIGMIGLNPHTGRPLNLGVRSLSSFLLSCGHARNVRISQYLLYDHCRLHVPWQNTKSSWILIMET